MLSNLQVNAAIEKLINDESREAAAGVLIDFSNSLQVGSRIYADGTRRYKNDDAVVTGHTKEQGNVSIKTSRDESKEYSFGQHIARVGYYKIFMPFEGIINFHHFWKADLTTQSYINEDAVPTMYRLRFDKESRKPIYFGHIESESIRLFTFFGFTLFRITQILHVQWGKDEGKTKYVGRGWRFMIIK